jgi:hypothetical protein
MGSPKYFFYLGHIRLWCVVTPLLPVVIKPLLTGRGLPVAQGSPLWGMAHTPAARQPVARPLLSAAAMNHPD